MLVTYRPEYEGALAQLHGAQTVAVAPLSDSETAALITELLGAHPTVRALGQTIAERAAGNPFFAEEIVRELAGRGVLRAVADLASWVEGLADGKLLDPDMQARRIASLQSTDPAQADAPQYGLAIAKFGALYGHTGEVPGINTFAGTDPQNKVTIVVWVNLDPTADGRAAATLIAKGLINEMYGSSTPTPTR